MSVQKRVEQPLGFESMVAEAWVSLLVAADHCAREVEAVCAERGITGEQYNVLRILRGAHPRGHPRCEVTRRLLRRSPDVTRMLNRLERQRLAKRERSAEDGRLSVAYITKAGLTLLEQIDPEIKTVMTQTMAPVNDTQLRQLARICDLLVR